MEAIWLLSLALSIATLLILLVLIFVRLIMERRQRIRASQSSRLRRLLFDNATPDTQLQLEVRRYPDLMTDLLVELIQKVRGDDRRLLVEKALALGLAERLHRRLADGPAYIRLLTAESLGYFNDPASRQWLITALDDHSSEVRLTAAIALANGEDAPPVSNLIDHLKAGHVEESKLLVSLFRQLAHTQMQEIRELILSSTIMPAVRAIAIEALSTSGDYSLVPVINSLTAKVPPDSQELVGLLHALGEFGHPAGAPTVRQSLESPYWWVRSAAAEASGHIGLTDLAPRLAALLDDENWWVRFRSGEALTLLGPEGLRHLREAALRASPSRASESAAAILAEKGLAL